MLDLNRVHIGDARELAKMLAPQSIHCICTSPPYFNLRAYLPAAHPDKHRELGGEATPDEFVANLVALFAALRPALHDSGTIWLNLGDSYCTRSASREKGNRDVIRAMQGDAELPTWKEHAAAGRVRYSSALKDEGLKDKDLIGIPWMTAFALRADGWYLRSAITWAKKSCMPESVTDRPTSATELVFLFAKQSRYFYDALAIREGEEVYTRKGTKGGHKLTQMDGYKGIAGGTLARDPDEPYGFARDITTVGRNARNFWLLGPEPFPDAHFATFPSEIPRRAIRAGSSERGVCRACGAPYRRCVEVERWATRERTRGPKSGEAFVPGRNSEKGQHGIYNLNGQSHGKNVETTGWSPTCTCDAGVRPALVLDPFLGSGTTAQVAVEEGRDWIGFDLDSRSVGWTARRLARLPVRSLFAATPAD